ncbi:EF-hand domain-containing protein [Thalassobaculum sp.]|uniref:EF-hand domain-containing protein n=1 Tax=Thalassobaculum sp. TaxID=2022740 RepID=UPI0032EFD090
MTRTRVTLAAALTLAAAGIAVAASEGAFAHGKDGMTMRGERMEQRFAAADADGDGKLTAAEMQAAHKARFAKADVNGDGKLSVDELDEARKAERMERLNRMVVWLDADGDGMLSVDEFDPRRGHMLSRMDRDGDGALSQEEMREAGKRYRHGNGGHHGGHGAPDQDRPKN